MQVDSLHIEYNNYFEQMQTHSSEMSVYTTIPVYRKRPPCKNNPYFVKCLHLSMVDVPLGGIC